VIAQPQSDSMFNEDNNEEEGHRLEVSSATFKDKTTVPLSMVFTGCSGQDKSPQLTWHGAPDDTRSFTVLMFDVTASFTHWGMYNIQASTTSLPENAGVAGSPFGSQIINDFFFPFPTNEHYDGPCPPPGLVHHYVITVFALDKTLNLPSAQQFFQPNGETLLYALLKGRSHILASGHITGLFST